jgi:hypothetical protein
MLPAGKIQSTLPVHEQPEQLIWCQLFMSSPLFMAWTAQVHLLMDGTFVSFVRKISMGLAVH